MIGRAIGWALFLLGLAIGARDLYVAYVAGGSTGPAPRDQIVIEAGSVPLSGGELWCEIHCGSLQLAQPAVERYISPWPWQNVIQPVLEWPAFATIGGLGLIFLFLFRRRRR